MATRAAETTPARNMDEAFRELGMAGIDPLPPEFREGDARAEKARLDFLTGLAGNLDHRSFKRVSAPPYKYGRVDL
jgi:hypothetical protein